MVLEVDIIVLWWGGVWNKVVKLEDVEVVVVFGCRVGVRFLSLVRRYCI